MNDPDHILITGRDEALLSTRGSVLKAAGYRVTTKVVPIERADDLSAVDLLVVCHTLSADQREHDLTVLREANPQAKPSVLFHMQDVSTRRLRCSTPLPGRTRCCRP